MKPAFQTPDQPRRLAPHAAFSAVAAIAAVAAIGVAASTFASHAAAQSQDPAQFPAAAVRFLNDELPRMDAAVAARDRDFFEDATARMVSFSEDWGFKAHANPALARYAMCTDAVSDYVVVGLCRLTPASDVCDPALAARFDANVRRCREAAR